MSRGSNNGQSLLELSLVLPLVLILIVNTVNFGALFYDWITVANGSRAGAQYMIMAGISAGFPPQPNASQITTVIANDLKSLRNASTNVTIKICTNNNGATNQTSGGNAGTKVACTCENLSGGAVTCPANEGGSINSGDNTDGFSESPGEATRYVLATVDVSYNYDPLIQLINFPALHIYTTLPPTTIHRTAVMRMLQ